MRVMNRFANFESLIQIHFSFDDHNSFRNVSKIIHFYHSKANNRTKSKNLMNQHIHTTNLTNFERESIVRNILDLCLHINRYTLGYLLLLLVVFCAPFSLYLFLCYSILLYVFIVPSPFWSI